MKILIHEAICCGPWTKKTICILCGVKQSCIALLCVHEEAPKAHKSQCWLELVFVLILTGSLEKRLGRMHLLTAWFTGKRTGMETFLYIWSLLSSENRDPSLVVSMEIWWCTQGLLGSAPFSNIFTAQCSPTVTLSLEIVWGLTLANGWNQNQKVRRVAKSAWTRHLLSVMFDTKRDVAKLTLSSEKFCVQWLSSQTGQRQHISPTSTNVNVNLPNVSVNFKS